MAKGAAQPKGGPKPRRSSGGVAKPPRRPAKPAAAAAAKPAATAGAEAPAAAPAPAAGKPNRPPTAFESRLYAVCKCIPAGRVATYGVMAEVLGSAPRACGQALRRNPYAPVVPCHRVIAASLELGGFSGGWGLGCDTVHKKRRLLEEEGVRFDDHGRLLASDKSAVMTAAELRAAASGVL
ncbi:RING-2 [Chlorella sorokiniana]|uniref:Methylated-DNA--protein-cysteine methyltransferase n=1 Tax=Chlorella sorokiniana TaxID=3076 RepID=A0A2P6TZL5_CHLSO|nr:RING-2 [Chlorella sorokiniana]|eukprot:PRW59512.1 RING-2 [Chlorella sorokiniana]